MPKLHRIARAAWFAVLIASFPVASIPAAAQSTAPIVGVRITTSLPSASVWVDGTEYRQGGHFLWPEGSKHTIEIRKPIQINDFCHQRWRFTGWTVESGPLPNAGSPVIVYTTDRNQAQIHADFVMEYRLDLLINDDPLEMTWAACEVDYRPDEEDNRRLPPNPMGFVASSIAGSFLPLREFHNCLSTSGWTWVAAGATVDLSAFPYPGYGFLGWEEPGAPGTGFLGQIVMNRHHRFRARFGHARRVTLVTAPEPGLSVVFDREIVRTLPLDAECIPAYYPPEVGGAQNPGSQVPGLPIAPFQGETACRLIPLCEGQYDLVPGSVHMFGAPPAQRDKLGRLWVFDHWDFGAGIAPGEQDSTVVIPQDFRSHTFTARFVRGTVVSLGTEPASLKLKVDGRDNWPSYNFEWGVGHTHSIAAPLEQTDRNGRRWRFVGWSNDGEAEQQYLVPQDAPENGLRLVARYELLGQLTLRSEPAQLTLMVDGQECTTPCVVDRPAGTEVVVAAQPERSFSEDTRIEFDGWSDSPALERPYQFSQEAHTLTARYQHFHRLTLLSDPEEGAKYTLTPAAGPGGFFTAGVRVQVNVEGNPGFRFRRWDGVLSGTLPTGAVTMNRPATVAARFDRVPALPEGAVQNAAGETPVKAVAPGSLIAVRGKHLSPGYEFGHFNPLKQTLLDVTVHVGNWLLPLVKVSSEEIIAQLPSTVPPGEHKLTVRQPGHPPVTVDFEVVPVAPGLFMQPETELPYAEVYHANGHPVTPENPARPGETLLLTGTGFGRTNPHWLDGFATPESPLLPLVNALELFVEGEPQPHLWAGAQPNRVGRTLIRFVLGAVTPGEDSDGRNLRLKVRVQGRDSNVVLLPVAGPAEQ